ncbi:MULTISPECIES: response regulator transcription factor [unclassified Pseudomonas]|uniref:response regulator n=1 Tax=unclassified Pseudomonas TaxID=196821 RepID=UPI000EAA5BAB|nr:MULTISPECIES: response regulator transcription factor [unclassified Pseudomonas]AYF85819.1 DNA-binding response regulator [Pseudomonas sp. DY-1]MDH4655009.1 response regulator transcription factor [Pseudomonas sp. BN606]MRK19500.1 response regulator transcription factor [Pseudomonas sp. JG-B]
MEARIRIGIVDDHPLLRQGVASALKRIGDFQVVEQGGCSEDALDIALRLQPDVLLMDVNMPGDCFAAVRRITAEANGVRVLMLTVSESEDDAYAALEAGAQGYVLKGVSGPELVQAIRTVAGGGSFITPAFASRLLGRMRRRQDVERHRIELTHREEQIIREVANGLTNREVADRLNLSEKTVKYYMTNVMQKLHARNRVEAVTALRRQWDEDNVQSLDVQGKAR